MTDLIEDKKGRIWCHNFSGQIFYIENLQLHLLKEYKFEEEQGYPRIVICGDELIATSIKGVFVYNLLSGKANYYPVPTGTTNLTCVKRRVVCISPSGIYCYEAGKPIYKLTDDARLPGHHLLNLQNVTFKDTFYIIANSLRKYFTVTLEGNNVKVQSEHQTSAFINTVSVDNNKAWIHTKEDSYTADGLDSVKDMNLSDIITDHEGHRWMSSLKKGLCVQYNTRHLEQLSSPFLDSSDDIRRTFAEEDQIFLGTVSGRLYGLSSPSSLRYLISVPKEAGAIERIVSVAQGQLLLATSIGLYFYNTHTGLLKHLPLPQTIKDIAIGNDKVYLATIGGVKCFPLAQINGLQPVIISESLFGKDTRCRSIAADGNRLIAAYSDGTYILHENKAEKLLFKNLPVYAAKIVMVSGKVLIGTSNQGLLILENGILRALTENDGLASNIIRDIKIMGGKIWLVYNDRFQQLNQSLTGVEDIAFPFSKIKSINDFALLNNRLYIATGDGIFTLPVAKPVSVISSATYIDQIMVNGKDLITGNTLKHNQNYLQFQVSTPFYSPYSNIVYQYRIKNAPDSTWQRGAPGQSVFNVVALEPGIYDFEIVATDDTRKIVSVPALYHFEILPPWYQRWYFRAGIALLAAALGFNIIRIYYQDRLRKQRLEYQKVLAVQAERQRISSEIHDDIGAGLSAICLQTELTKNKLPDGELKRDVGKIYAAVSELSHKMREVIWSLNTDNDKLENLLYYIRRQALLLFENSPIQLKVLSPLHEVPDIVIKGEQRRHIYLAVKEALHNCLKHSEAKTCTLSMCIEDHTLKISIADDGKGFALVQEEQTGNGLPGMKRRMQQMAGRFEVLSQESTIVNFIIPLYEKHE